jgi:hypothetical protein
MKKIMMFCLCIYGCADYQEHNGKGYPKEFTPYVIEYLSIANKYKPVRDSILRDLTITYKDLSDVKNETGITVGLCETKINERIIYIDPTFWEQADYYLQMSLIFHELGHCLSGFEHRDKRSIMNASVVHDLEYNYDYYMVELFE